MRPHPWSVGVEDPTIAVSTPAAGGMPSSAPRRSASPRRIPRAARSDSRDPSTSPAAGGPAGRRRPRSSTRAGTANGGPGEPERVVGPVRADLQRLQRQPQVVDRARGAREVVDEVDPLGDLDVPRQVLQDEGERVVAQVLDVRERPVSRLSRQITRCPLASSASHRCEPRNPAPPVTSDVGIAGDPTRHIGEDGQVFT